MTVSPDFRDLVLDMLAPLGVTGTLEARRMFGGVALRLDGLTFALIDDDVLYLKVDDDTRARFEAAGLAPFTPDPAQPERRMSYYPPPAEAMEDGTDLLAWARLGVDAALRAAAQKKAPTTRRRKAPTPPPR